MTTEQVERLRAQVQQAEEAEAALFFSRQFFGEMRAEIYRRIENEDGNPPLELLRAKLIVMRDIENKLEARIRDGKLAMKELTD